MNIWLYGYYGHSNVGDEAILLSVKRLLRERGEEPFILTDNISKSKQSQEGKYILGLPLSVKKGWKGQKYKVGYWLRNGLYLLPKLMFHKNICIYTSGGAFNDHVLGRVVEIEKRMKVLKSLGFKVGIVGAGVDSYVSVKDKEATVRILHDHINYMSVRDSESGSVLCDIGVDRNKYNVSTDVVFAIGPEENDREFSPTLEESTLALNLRPLFMNLEERGSNKYERYRDYKSNSQVLVDRISKNVRKLVLLPFAPEDEKFLRSFQFNSNVSVENFSSSPEDLLNKIKSYDIVVGMRFHSFVLSVIAGVPCVPIPYSLKLVNLAKEIGMDVSSLIIGDGTEVVDQSLNVDAILDYIHKTYQDRTQVCKRYEQFSIKKAEIAKKDLKNCLDQLV